MIIDGLNDPISKLFLERINNPLNESDLKISTKYNLYLLWGYTSALAIGALSGNYELKAPAAKEYSPSIWGTIDSFIDKLTGNQPSNATIVHELHHSLRQRLTNLFNENFTNLAEQKDVYDWLRSTNRARLLDLLNLPQYTKGELDAMKLFLFKPETRASLTPTREIGATFAETRFDLRNKLINDRNWYNKIYRRIFKKPMITVEETNQYINGLQNVRRPLIQHSYGNDLLTDSWNHYRTNEPNVSEQKLKSYFDNWIKNSLIKLAGFGVPVTIGTYKNRDSDELD